MTPRAPVENGSAFHCKGSGVPRLSGEIQLRAQGAGCWVRAGREEVKGSKARERGLSVGESLRGFQPAQQLQAAEIAAQLTRGLVGMVAAVLNALDCLLGDKSKRVNFG